MVKFHQLPLKDGQGYTLQVELSDGEGTIRRYLHSRYHPVREAIQWVESVYERHMHAYAIYGMGALHHIKALYDKTKEEENEVMIFVVEPFEEVWHIAQREDSFKDLLADPRMIFVSSLEEVSIRKQLYQLDKNVLRTMKVVIYPSYKDLDLSMEKIFLETVRNTKVKMVLERNTVYAFRDCFPENLVKNAKYMLSAAKIDQIRNLFPNRTAVVVSAGPSLEKNIDQLKEYQDRVLIIAGGRSAQALLKRGICPHFICNVDSHETNYKLYQEMDILDSEIPMITSWGAHYQIVQEYAGKKVFFNDSGMKNLSDLFFGRWIDSIAISLTVASLQMRAAIVMGCSTVIFVGQDMAYAGDARYGKDTSSEVDEQDYSFYFVKGNIEEKVRTTVDLDSFRLYFEEQIDEIKNCIFINATEGGAYIRGTKIMSLAEALRVYAGKKEDFRCVIDGILRVNESIQDKLHFRKSMEKMYIDAKKLHQYGKEALKLSLRVSLDYYKNKPILKKLEKIDKKIESVKETTELADSFIQEEIAILSERTAEEMKDKEIIAETNLLYRSIMNAGEKMTNLLKEEIESLDEFYLLK